MSIYFCSICQQTKDNDNTPMTVCPICDIDICNDCVEEENDICDDCAKLFEK